MAAKVTFHGLEKEIRVKSGVTDINVKVDLYSDWKEWVLEGLNSTWLPAFNVIGGNPTSAGQFAPTYFFLINGWKLIVDGVNITVGINLYTDNGDSPYIISNNGSVNAINSDIPGLSNSQGGGLDEESLHSALDSYPNKNAWKGRGGGGGIQSNKGLTKENLKEIDEMFEKYSSNIFQEIGKIKEDILLEVQEKVISGNIELKTSIQQAEDEILKQGSEVLKQGSEVFKECKPIDNSKELQKLSQELEKAQSKIIQSIPSIDYSKIDNNVVDIYKGLNDIQANIIESLKQVDGNNVELSKTLISMGVASQATMESILSELND